MHCERENIKYLVWNADDLGQQLSCNAGILKAATEGLLTSASLRANGVAYDHALQDVIPACPHIGIGAHICFNEGTALSPASKSALLHDARGNFNFLGVRGFIQIALRGANKRFREEIKTELRCQVEKVLSATAIDHIDGHFHIHAIPFIFTMVVDIAEEYGIPFVRVPSEPFFLSCLATRVPSVLHVAHYCNLQMWCAYNKRILRNKAVQSNDVFYGLLYSSVMHEAITKALLANNTRHGIIEMLHHPALPVADETYMHAYVKEFCLSHDRQAELDALLSARVKHIIHTGGYTLTNYAALAAQGKTGMNGPSFTERTVAAPAPVAAESDCGSGMA